MDVLRIALSDRPIEESHEDKPGVILGYDAANIAGLEILQASTRITNRHTVEYATA